VQKRETGVDKRAPPYNKAKIQTDMTKEEIKVIIDMRNLASRLIYNTTPPKKMK